MDAAVETRRLDSAKTLIDVPFDEFGIKVPVTVLQVRPFARFSTRSCAQVPFDHDPHIIN
jgi:hypothetical protein